VLRLRATALLLLAGSVLCGCAGSGNAERAVDAALPAALRAYSCRRVTVVHGGLFLCKIRTTAERARCGTVAFWSSQDGAVTFHADDDTEAKRRENATCRLVAG